MRITPFLRLSFLFVRSNLRLLLTSTKPIRRMNKRDILIVRFIMSVCTLAMTMTDAKPRRIAMHITNKYRTLCPVLSNVPAHRLLLGWVSKMHRDETERTLRLIKFHRVMWRLLFFRRWKTHVLFGTRAIVKANESRSGVRGRSMYRLTTIWLIFRKYATTSHIRQNHARVRWLFFVTGQIDKWTLYARTPSKFLFAGWQSTIGDRGAANAMANVPSRTWKIRECRHRDD